MHLLNACMCVCVCVLCVHYTYNINGQIHCTTIQKYVNIFICTVHKLVLVCTSFIAGAKSAKCWVCATHTRTDLRTCVRTWIWALSFVRCIRRRRPYTRTHGHTYACTISAEDVMCVCITYMYGQARMRTRTPTDTFRECGQCAVHTFLWTNLHACSGSGLNGGFPAGYSM